MAASAPTALAAMLARYTARRRRASTASPAMSGTACLSCARSAIAALNSACSVASSGMNGVQQGFGFARFAKQHVEFRNSRIPFDQRAHAPQPRQRGFVQRPDRVGDVRAMIVDQAQFGACVAGEM